MNNILNFIWRRKYKPNKKVTMLFLPKSSDCAVAKVVISFVKKHVANNHILILDKWYYSFKILFDEKIKDTIIPQKKFVFAHGDVYSNGFKTLGSKVIKSDWFDAPPYSLAVFHSCKGSLVLSNPDWDKVFDDWVSYKSDLDYVSGVPILEKCWAELYSFMIEALKEINDSDALVNEFTGIYLDKLEYADSLSIGDGGHLLKCNIQEALSSLQNKSK